MSVFSSFIEAIEGASPLHDLFAPLLQHAEASITDEAAKSEMGRQIGSVFSTLSKAGVLQPIETVVNTAVAATVPAAQPVVAAVEGVVDGLASQTYADATVQ